jgi:hypothetical protein
MAGEAPRLFGIWHRQAHLVGGGLAAREPERAVSLGYAQIKRQF